MRRRSRRQRDRPSFRSRSALLPDHRLALRFDVHLRAAMKAGPPVIRARAPGTRLGRPALVEWCWLAGAALALSAHREERDGGDRNNREKYEELHVAFLSWRVVALIP